MLGACLILAATTMGAPVVLDNGAIHVVASPELFAVVDISIPEGAGFVEALPVSEADQEGRKWLDPGGLVTDVLPLTARDAALRRGPAQVVEQDANHVILESPESASTGLKLRKEITLDPDGAASALFRVTLTSSRSESMRVYLRNTARLPKRCTLRVARQDATIRALAGVEIIYPAVVKSLQYWLIPVPPTVLLKNAVLGAFTPKVSEEREYVAWERRLPALPSTPDTFDHGVSFLCLLDSASNSYGSALQSAQVEVDASHPFVFEEEWRFTQRGQVRGLPRKGR